MERAAFDPLLTATLPQIEEAARKYAIKFRLTGEYMDICQSALLKMLRFADQYDPAKGDLLPWACVVIINTIKTRIAQLAAYPCMDELGLLISDHAQSTPEDDLHLSFMLNTLGKEARLYAEGYKYAEIAAQCGVKSKSTVKSRIDKGAARLCGILKRPAVFGKRERMVAMAPD